MAPLVSPLIPARSVVTSDRPQTSTSQESRSNQTSTVMEVQSREEAERSDAPLVDEALLRDLEQYERNNLNQEEEEEEEEE